MLLYRSEHGLGGTTEGRIRESADREVVGDTHAEDFRHMQHARSTIVVDAEDGIGSVVLLEDAGGGDDGSGAGVALEDHIVGNRDMVAHQGIAPPLVAAARDLELD